MKDVEHNNSKHHSDSIQTNEEPLPCDQISRPALQQLNRAVDASHVDAYYGERRCQHQQAHSRGEPGTELRATTPNEKVDTAEGKRCDGGHLEYNTGHHCVGPWGSVPVDFACCGRGHSTTHCLYDQ